jgi:hypothetical protein
MNCREAKVTEMAEEPEVSLEGHSAVLRQSGKISKASFKHSILSSATTSERLY